MKIGILIDHRGMDPQAIKQFASLSDELGYHSISLCDKARVDDEYLDSWSLLPGIALNTKNARILPLVSDNLVRHPGILAKMATTIDIISHGRLDFGIGAGLRGPPDLVTRVAMLRESIQVILKLWTEMPSSTFVGEYYNLNDAESLPKPIQKPHPPILVGGIGKSVLDICAKYGEMSNFNLQGIDLNECTKLLDRLKSSCEKNARDYQSILKTVVGVCAIGKGSNSASLFGSTTEIVEQLSGYEKIGIDRFIVKFPGETQLENVRLFADEILGKL